jgi:hypothetical protein
LASIAGVLQAIRAVAIVASTARVFVVRIKTFSQCPCAHSIREPR